MLVPAEPVPPETVLIEDAGKLADPGAVSVIVGEGTSRRDYLIVQSGHKIRVFENTCPHQGTPLETLAGRFFNRDRTRLLCSTHGAEFRIDNGLCTKGPCLGKRLRRVTVKISGTAVILVKAMDP